MQRQYQAALDVLQEIEVNEAGVAKQAHTLLVTHVQAELYQISEAKERIRSLGDVHEHGLIAWRDALKVRYHLNGRPSPPSPEEIEQLDQTIEEQELRYALAY